LVLRRSDKKKLNQIDETRPRTPTSLLQSSS
jgi:hypothetical protein